MIDLEAIRVRDALGDNSPPEAYSRRDRRALLAYVDALRAAAGKVTYFDYCDDDEDVQQAVADLRALLEGEL